MTYFANASFGNKTSPAYVIDNNTGQVQQYYGGHQAMQAARDMENQYAGGNQFGGMGGYSSFGTGQPGGSGTNNFYDQSIRQSQQIQQMRNQGMYGGTANQTNGQNALFGTGGGTPLPGGGGGGAAYGAGNIDSLIQRQLSENDWAKQQNIGNWNTASQMIQGLSPSYFGDQITQQTRGQASNLLADPYSLNADVMSKMKAQRMGQIDNAVNGQMRDANFMAAMNGQTDASSMQAAAERADRMALGASVDANSQLEIQKALQDKQDLTRAIGVGQQQSAQDQGVRSNQAALFADSMPQYKADDLSGLIAGLGAFNYGVNKGMSQGPALPQNPGTDGTYGGQFSGWQNFGGGPLNLSVNNQSGTPQNPAGWGSMFNASAATAWDNDAYNKLSNQRNQQNTASWNRFAGTQTGGGLPTRSAPQGGYGQGRYGGSGSFA